MPVDQETPPTPAPSRPRPGTVSWLDLSTPDVEGASRFYGALLGWAFEDTAAGSSRIARVRGRDIAGLTPAAPPAGPGRTAAWTVFVEVASPDDVAAAAAAAGGDVLTEPQDVPGGGRVAVLADPAGAMLVALASPPRAEPLDRGRPGGLYWTEVLSRDAAAARAFAASVLGWDAETGPTGYTVFRCGGEPVAGLTPMPLEVPREAPSHWFVSFVVGDLDAALAAVPALGGRVDRAPMDLPDGRFAVVEDPQGAVLGLFAPRPEGAR